VSSKYAPEDRGRLSVVRAFGNHNLWRCMGFCVMVFLAVHVELIQKGANERWMMLELNAVI
jgi:hypothetical protein